MNKKDYIKNLPQKRMACGVILLNAGGKILLLKPTYKDHWTVPGGVIEKDESPKQAALRETQEEIGIKLRKVQLLCVDYMSPKDSGYITKDENIQFIFYGGVLSPRQIRKIKLDTGEIGEFDFCSQKKAYGLLNKNLAKRMLPCYRAIKTGQPVYLEGGAS